MIRFISEKKTSELAILASFACQIKKIFNEIKATQNKVFFLLKKSAKNLYDMIIVKVLKIIDDNFKVSAV